MGTASVWEDEGFGGRWWRRLHSSVNVPNATKLHELKFWRLQMHRLMGKWVDG